MGGAADGGGGGGGGGRGGGQKRPPLRGELARRGEFKMRGFALVS